MPYRRLPNTDQSRLKALQKAVQRASVADFTERVINYKTLKEAENFLMQFEIKLASTIKISSTRSRLINNIAIWYKMLVCIFPTSFKF